MVNSTDVPWEVSRLSKAIVQLLTPVVSQHHYDLHCKFWRCYAFHVLYPFCLTQALLSDGTLAWRFYVVFGKKKWALYLPAVAVMMNTCEFSICLLLFDLCTFHPFSALLVSRLPASRFLREQRTL